MSNFQCVCVCGSPPERCDYPKCLEANAQQQQQGRNSSAGGDGASLAGVAAGVAQALLAVLVGDPECPQIGPLSWLRSAIDELKARGPSADDEDPPAYWEMVSELEAFHRNATAAIAAEKPHGS